MKLTDYAIIQIKGRFQASHCLFMVFMLIQTFLPSVLHGENLINEQQDSVQVTADDSEIQSQDVDTETETETETESPKETKNPEEKQDNEPFYFWKADEEFYKELRLRQEAALQRSRQAANESQQNVSQRLHRFSSYVDRFFAEEDYIEESYESRLKVSVSNQYQKYYTPTLKPHTSLYLALPNTKNKWFLSLESDDSGNQEASQEANNLVNDENDSTLTTALGRKLKSNELVDIRFSAGIKFRTPIDPFAHIRGRRTFKFENVELRFTETLGWQDSYGKFAENNFVFEYPLTLKYFFRSGSTLTYWDVHTYWTGSQTLTLYRQLDKKSLIAYTIGINGQNEDTLHTRKKDQVNQYWIELRYRKNFYQNWLFYQITPGITWPREFEFEALPRIEFKLEAVYGYGEIQEAQTQEVIIEEPNLEIQQ